MLVLPLGVKENCTNFLQGAFLEKVLGPVPGFHTLWAMPRALLLALAALPEMEELHQLRKHSERLALVQGGPS